VPLLGTRLIDDVRPRSLRSFIPGDGDQVVLHSWRRTLSGKAGLSVVPPPGEADQHEHDQDDDSDMEEIHGNHHSFQAVLI
jgi:hypothetical protein